jgi:hypothetical protein
MTDDEGISIPIKAINEASAVMNEVKSDLDSMTGKVKETEEAQKKMVTSTKDLAVGLSSVATGAWTLYQGYDNLIDAQVGVDKSMLAAKSSANAAEDSQKKYNDTVTKFGADSPEAVAALKDLELAQERASVSADRAEMVQGNLSEAYTGFALRVVPSVISIGAGLGTTFKQISDSGGLATIAQNAMGTASKGLSGAMSLISAHPILAMLGLLVAALIYAYQNCEPFRNAVNALGKSLTEALGPAIEFVNSVVTELGKIWQEVAPSISEVFSTYVVPIVNLIGVVLVAAIKTWISNIQTLYGIWTTIMSGIKSAYDTYVAPIVNLVINFATSVITAFQNLYNAIVGSSSWTDLCKGISGLWNSIVAPVLGVITGWVNGIIGVFNTLSSTVTGIWNALSATATNVWNGIKTAVQTPIDAVKTSLGTAWTGVQTTVGGIWNSLQTSAGTIWNGIKTTISGSTTSMSTSVNGYVDALGRIPPAKTTVITETGATASTTGIIQNYVDAINRIPASKTTTIITKYEDTGDSSSAQQYASGGTISNAPPTTTTKTTTTTTPAPVSTATAPITVAKGSGLTPMASGFEGLVSQPLLALIGEKGPEYVSVKPINQLDRTPPQNIPTMTSISINFTGPISISKEADIKQLYQIFSDRLRSEMKNRDRYTSR